MHTHTCAGMVCWSARVKMVKADSPASTTSQCQWAGQWQSSSSCLPSSAPSYCCSTSSIMSWVSFTGHKHTVYPCWSCDKYIVYPCWSHDQYTVYPCWSSDRHTVCSCWSQDRHIVCPCWSQDRHIVCPCWSHDRHTVCPCWSRDRHTVCPCWSCDRHAHNKTALVAVVTWNQK